MLNQKQKKIKDGHNPSTPNFCDYFSVYSKRTCLGFFFFVVIQIIDEADRMIDSMHQLWLSQVVKAVYRSGSGPEATSIFKRTEPTHVTAARYGIKLRLPAEEHNR